jgi:hypothetical protein
MPQILGPTTYPTLAPPYYPNNHNHLDPQTNHNQFDPLALEHTVPPQLQKPQSPQTLRPQSA